MDVKRNNQFGNMELNNAIIIDGRYDHDNHVLGNARKDSDRSDGWVQGPLFFLL